MIAEKNLKYVLPRFLQYFKELGYEICSLSSVPFDNLR
jgi:hypothetical protein